MVQWCIKCFDYLVAMGTKILFFKNIKFIKCGNLMTYILQASKVIVGQAPTHPLLEVEGVPSDSARNFKY